MIYRCMYINRNGDLFNFCYRTHTCTAIVLVPIFVVGVIAVVLLIWCMRRNRNPPPPPPGGDHPPPLPGGDHPPPLPGGDHPLPLPGGGDNPMNTDTLKGIFM